MDIQPGHVVAGGGGLSALVGLVVWALKAKDTAQQKELDEAKRSLAAAWAKLDTLAVERSQLWTRSDHQAWEQNIRQDNAALRLEIKADMRELGSQLMSRVDRAVESFNAAIKPLVEKCLTCQEGKHG